MIVIPDSEPVYNELESIISFAKFRYDRGIEMQEQHRLVPQLKALGYTEIEFYPAPETFGNGVRACRARNRTGTVIHFVYG